MNIFIMHNNRQVTRQENCSILLISNEKYSNFTQHTHRRRHRRESNKKSFLCYIFFVHIFSVKLTLPTAVNCSSKNCVFALVMTLVIACLCFYIHSLDALTFLCKFINTLLQAVIYCLYRAITPQTDMLLSLNHGSFIIHTVNKV